jgi:hypothetical protein
MDESTVIIPVEPHVKAYVLNNVFINKPFRISMGESFGIFVYTFLENKKKGRPFKHDPDKVIEVQLTRNRNWRYKMYMPPEKAKAFNNLMEKRLKEEFDLLVNTVVKYMPNAKVDRLIREFEAKYDLDGTKMSFESLKRRYYRNKSALETVVGTRI